MCGGGLAHKENNTLHMTMIKNGKIKIGGGGKAQKIFYNIDPWIYMYNSTRQEP
jgi:hypothetical protein